MRSCSRSEMPSLSNIARICGIELRLRFAGAGPFGFGAE
jgi:hypothetical protein